MADVPGSSTDRWPYYLATFLAIVGLESIPRFLFELKGPILLVPRLILLAIFFGVAWFFTHALHEKFRWSTLAGMFFLDAIVAVTLAILLILQLYTVYFVYVGLIILLVRALLFSYLVTRPLPHLKSLVFFSCAVIMVAGELILISARL